MPPTSTDERRIAATARVRELVTRKVRQGFSYRWWLDLLDDRRIDDIIDAVLDAGQEGER